MYYCGLVYPLWNLLFVSFRDFWNVGARTIARICFDDYGGAVYKIGAFSKRKRCSVFCLSLFILGAIRCGVNCGGWTNGTSNCWSNGYPVFQIRKIKQEFPAGFFNNYAYISCSLGATDFQHNLRNHCSNSSNYFFCIALEESKCSYRLYSINRSAMFDQYATEHRLLVYQHRSVSWEHAKYRYTSNCRQFISSALVLGCADNYRRNTHLFQKHQNNCQKLKIVS